MDFKNLKELEKFLQAKIDKALQTDVAQDAKELMKKHVESDVYAQYKPTLYVRRKENGGLLDDSNYLIQPVENGVSITNVTTDDGYSEEFGDYFTPSENWVVPAIEYGRPYNWGLSEIYQTQQARPFVENTRIDLASGKYRESLKRALIKNKLEVE